jgi:hypothetical protein
VEDNREHSGRDVTLMDFAASLAYQITKGETMYLHTTIGDFVAHFRYTEEPPVVVPRKIQKEMECEPHWRGQEKPLMVRVVTCILHKGEHCERREGICTLPALTVGKEQAIGKTWCSLLDPFIIVEGRKLAFERAIQILSRADRTVLWDAYKAKARYIKPKPRARAAHAR